MTTILAITGDVHANSTVGLCPPKVELDDGGRYISSDRQRWIWGRWLSYVLQVKRLKDKTGHEVVLVLLGELVDNIGKKIATSQVVTTNVADVLHIGDQVLEPMLAVADKVIVLRGTEAHVGSNSCLDEIVAERINHKYGTIVKSPIGTNSWYQFRGEFDGVTIDAAHHPGVGNRTHHTAGNEATRLASKIFYEYSIDNIIRSRTGEPIVAWPHLILRGHNHRPADSGDNQPGGHPIAAMRALITPSWQLGTAYSYRLGGGVLPIGGLIAVASDGRVNVNKLFYYPAPGTFLSTDSYKTE